MLNASRIAVSALDKASTVQRTSSPFNFFVLHRRSIQMCHRKHLCFHTVSAHSPNVSSVSAVDSTKTSSAQFEWQRSDLHVVLVNPQIPQNAGNIARTCAATSIALHLVGPLGFELDDTKLKRAGLDYWDWVCFDVHPCWDDFHSFFRSLPGQNKMIAFSKFGTKHHASDSLYTSEAATWLVFGAETTGLPQKAVEDIMGIGGDIVKIPMSNFKHVRSLNLATSVGIGVFEALRQLDGPVLPEDLAGSG